MEPDFDPNSECGFCWDSLDNDEPTIQITPCGHRFHSACTRGMKTCYNCVAGLRPEAQAVEGRASAEELMLGRSLIGTRVRINGINERRFNWINGRSGTIIPPGIDEDGRIYVQLDQDSIITGGNRTLRIYSQFIATEEEEVNERQAVEQQVNDDEAMARQLHQEQEHQEQERQRRQKQVNDDAVMARQMQAEREVPRYRGDGGGDLPTSPHERPGLRQRSRGDGGEWEQEQQAPRSRGLGRTSWWERAAADSGSGGGGTAAGYNYYPGGVSENTWRQQTAAAEAAQRQREQAAAQRQRWQQEQEQRRQEREAATQRRRRQAAAAEAQRRQAAAAEAQRRQEAAARQQREQEAAAGGAAGGGGGGAAANLEQLRNAAMTEMNETNEKGPKYKVWEEAENEAARQRVAAQKAEELKTDAIRAEAAKASAKAGNRGMSKEEAYRVLGLPRSASQHEVKQTYYKLARMHHPHRGGDAANFTRIQDAYELLYEGNQGGGRLRRKNSRRTKKQKTSVYSRRRNTRYKYEKKKHSIKRKLRKKKKLDI